MLSRKSQVINLTPDQINNVQREKMERQRGAEVIEKNLRNHFTQLNPLHANNIYVKGPAYPWAIW